MQAEKDPVSEKLLPYFSMLTVVAIVAMFVYFMGGMLNLFLGRERVVQAKFIGTEVRVRQRSNAVTSTFDASGHPYQLTLGKGLGLDSQKPADLVVDGLFWDEIVEVRQDGKVLWTRN